MTIETKLIALAQAMGADVKALKAADGDLTALSTTAKGNLVAALNEVFDLVGQGGGEDPTKLPLTGGKLTGALNYADQAVVTAQSAVDIASAPANYVLISGSGATINTLGSGSDGMRRVVRFNGVNTLKSADGSILLPGGLDIVTADGDLAEFYCRTGNSWRCLWYTKINGTAVIAGDGVAYLPKSGGNMTGPINFQDYGYVQAADNLDIGNSQAVRVDSNSSTVIDIGNFAMSANAPSGAERTVFFNTDKVRLMPGLIKLPGNQPITVAPGDIAKFRAEGGADWRCLFYTRRDGRAIIESSGPSGPAIDDTAGLGDTDVVWSADKSQTFVTQAVATLEASLLGGAGEAYDTFKELQDLILADQSGLAALAADIQNRVRFDAAQVLTVPQKEQARTNIGAVAQADIDATIVATVGDYDHDFVADYVAAKA